MPDNHFLETADPIEERVTRQRDALLTLSQLQLSSCESLPELLRQILGVAASALRVPRVSIWRFNDDRQAIECVLLYDAATGKYEHAGVLSAADFPRYFEAMTSSDVFAVDDAETDPRTAEFTVPYLRPLRIKSMMDAPIHLDAGAVGVLCHEQTDTVRHWTQDEKSFSIAVANVIALAFERCERTRADAEPASGGAERCVPRDPDHRPRGADRLDQSSVYDLDRLHAGRGRRAETWGAPEIRRAQ
jgi:GAF domain-containing protein